VAVAVDGVAVATTTFDAMNAGAGTGGRINKEPKVLLQRSSVR